MAPYCSLQQQHAFIRLETEQEDPQGAEQLLDHLENTEAQPDSSIDKTSAMQSEQSTDQADIQFEHPALVESYKQEAEQYRDDIGG